MEALPTETWPAVVNNALNLVQLVLLAWIARNGHAKNQRDRIRDRKRPPGS